MNIKFLAVYMPLPWNTVFVKEYTNKWSTTEKSGVAARNSRKKSYPRPGPSGSSGLKKDEIRVQPKSRR